MTPIAVAVVSFNTRDVLRACLSTVESESPADLVVVDNGSSDGSAEMVRREFPRAHLVVCPSNPGYGAGANLAVRSCSAPYVLLLNSDTRLARGALQALGDYLDEHPRAAVVGPRLTDPEGTLQISCFPFPGTFQLCLEKTPIGKLLGRVAPLRDHYLTCHWPHDRPRVVPWVLGAALALRRRAFDAVGGFDPSYFMYAEEVDLCYRLAAGGWEVHFAPVTRVVHVGGSSTGQSRSVMAVERVASARRFYRSHYSRPRAAGLSTAIRGAMLLRWIRDRGRRMLTRDAGLRARLADDLSVWLGALKGR